MSDSTLSARQRGWLYAGLFIVAAAALMLQVVQSRLLSVVLWYHLAFFVISLAMFGLTAGAIWVYVRDARFSAERLPQTLARYGLGMSATTAVGMLMQTYAFPLWRSDLTGAMAWVEIAIVIAAPFFAAGVIISLLLTRSGLPIGRAYAADMLGAALGSPAAVFLLDAVSAPEAALWVAALAALGAVCFARAAHELPTARVVAAAAAMFVLAGTASWGTTSSDLLRPPFVKGRADLSEGELLLDRWNSFSRVVAVETRAQGLFGPSALAADERRPMRVLTIDGLAGTAMHAFDGDLAAARFLQHDVTNLAYALPDRQRGAVIGVGGGRDLLSARALGVAQVVGVEVNPIFVDLLASENEFREYAGFDHLDGVQLVTAEARTWFAGSDDSFDVIQMSMVDTWAATGAGAFTLTENGLYTREAWSILMRRLRPGGVLSVSRWYSPGDVNETGRMVSLAVATLLDAGVESPARHIFVAAASRVATLLVSPSPLELSHREALAAAVDDLGFTTLLAPGVAPASEILGRIVASVDGRELERWTSGLELDLSPPTDDRPFFFNQLPLHRPADVIRLAGEVRGRGGVVAGNLEAAISLAIILLVCGALAAVAILVPATTVLRGTRPVFVLGGTLYFFLIGLGFMLTEIALLQRMSVFLGHPVFAFATVLPSIIGGAAAGSWMSDRLEMAQHQRLVMWAGATAAVLATLPFWWGVAFSSLAGSSTLVRLGFCVAVMLPVGCLLGFGFPTGMRLVSKVDSRPTPWFWGINGAAGVLGGVLAVFISIAFGISATLLAGAACYLLLPLPVGWMRAP